MPNIQINIKNKVARADRAIIVCDNSDYTAVFDFDDEWSAYDTKTVRFVYCGTYTDVVVTGNECPIPVIQDARSLYVGVYAGDLHTTTPACISCVPSILCGNGIPADPTPDVYAQIMELLGKISDESVAKAVTDALEQAKVSGEFDGEKGNDGVSPAVSVAAITGGNRVTITDAEGAKTFDVMDGAQGASGADGKDYVLTDADKQEIAKTAAGLVDVPSVQPDWNQNDETQPDYVKNRPFYTGTVKTVLMEESTVEFVKDHGMYVAEFPSTFVLTVGETYKVYWDGAAYECTCVSFSNIPLIGNLSIMGAGSDTGEPFLIGVKNGVKIQIVAADTSASHTFSISRFTQEVVKIDEKYLPDTVATKSEVEATQEVLDGVFSSVATFTFDKQTSGRDTFNLNGFNYYKISDFNPAPEDVISFKGTTESGDESTRIFAGQNCVSYRNGFIVVASAGVCSIAISETTTRSFTAPSAGLYAIYKEGNPNMTAGTAEFTLKPSSENYIYITGLFLKSSTAGSTKKFKITVDDSGTITATEVS